MVLTPQAFDAFWLKLLAIIWQHRDKLDDIADLVGKIAAAVAGKDFTGAFEAIYELGKLLLSMLTAPAAMSVTAYAREDVAVAAFETHRIGDGAIIRKLRDFLNSEEGQLLVGIIRKWFSL